MKTLFLILISFLVITGCNKEQNSPISSQMNYEEDSPGQKIDSVIVSIQNGHFAGDKYIFDLYARGIREGIRMSSSTLTLEVEKMYKFSAVSNPKLLYANPKYNLGSPGYDSMFTREEWYGDYEHLIYAQIVYHRNQGSGSALNTTDELICTIQLNYKFCIFELVWNDEYSMILVPPYRRIPASWNGYGRGCL